VIDRLTLLAPGDALPADGCALVLLDDRVYGAELFAPVAREVNGGPGVECETGDFGPTFRLRHPELGGTGQARDAHVLFFVGTDTDVKTQAPVARQFRHPVFVVQPGQDDSAARALAEEGFDSVRNMPGAHLPRADVALLSNDASSARREFIRRCRAAGMPTLCLQEAVNADFDGPPHRMRWADSVCVCGPQAIRYLQRRLMFLTGNPRFDGYTRTPMPAKAQVLINCNFILSLGGEKGPGWMKQVLGVVQELGIDFRVTKHPRDDTDLSGVENVLPSGAYKVAEQLAACSVLVSRDSSLPYEAMLAGRPVIYFDPYHEKERTLREDNSGLVRKCDTADGLRAALRESLEGGRIPGNHAPGFDPYAFIFTEPGAGSARRVARAIEMLATHDELYHTTDARIDSGFDAALREWIELRVRPHLRSIGPLRSVWRAARRRVGF
jgi:hypothetical protein